MKILHLAVGAVLLGFGTLALAAEFRIDTTEADGRLVDNIDLPFVNDPAVPGEWLSVDFVAEPGDFVPGVKKFRDELYLGGFNFFPGGKMGVLPDAPEAAPWFKWTRGVVTHSGDKTASRYFIKEIKGASYMFFEWKSGDYTIRHMKPEYYVLKKTARK